MILPYRDENPSRRFPVFTYLIILLNVGAFAYQVWLPDGYDEAFVRQYAMTPGVFSRTVKLLPTPWRIPPEVPLSPLVTTFLHGSILHILSNMLFLWIFGDNVEDRLGHFRFLLFYLGCGLIASLSHYVMNFLSPVPMVGASGAIAGVMGAYLWFFPRAKIRCVLIFFPFFSFLVPAWVILIYWFLTQLSSASMNVSMGAGDNIAWFAHIGGFIAGITYVSRKYQANRRL